MGRRGSPRPPQHANHAHLNMANSFLESLLQSCEVLVAQSPQCGAGSGLSVLGHFTPSSSVTPKRCPLKNTFAHLFFCMGWCCLVRSCQLFHFLGIKKSHIASKFGFQLLSFMSDNSFTGLLPPTPLLRCRATPYFN